MGKGMPLHARAYETNDRGAHWKRVVAKHGHTVHIAALWPSEAEAFEHEKFLIACFRAMGKPLVNHTDGGGGARGYIQQALAKAKISATHQGKSKSVQHRQRLADSNTNKKAVLCVTTNERFQSARQAAKLLGRGLDPVRISEVCLGKARTTRGLLFQFVDPEHRAAAEAKYPSKPFQKRPTICITTGQRFQSITDAAQAFGLDSRPVGECCHGNLKTTAGLKFQFAD